jgi:hypothetical protein
MTPYYLVELYQYFERKAWMKAGASILPKTNFVPTGHHHPWSSPNPHICTIPSASALFWNASWKSCSMRVSSTACDSAPSPQLCQMRAFHFYVQLRKQRKVVWVGTTVMFSIKNSPVKEEVRSVHCRDITAISFSPNFGVTSSHSRRKMSHYYGELTVWPTRTNSLWTIPLMPKEMMSMLLTLLFICLAFFGLGELGLSVCDSCSLPWTLVESLPGCPSHVFQDLHIIWLQTCSFVGTIAKCHQSRYKTPNKGT